MFRFVLSVFFLISQCKFFHFLFYGYCPNSHVLNKINNKNNKVEIYK